MYFVPFIEYLTSGTFVEFRQGMINVSPIGRNARSGHIYMVILYD